MVLACACHTFCMCWKKNYKTNEALLHYFPPTHTITQPNNAPRQRRTVQETEGLILTSKRGSTIELDQWGIPLSELPGLGFSQWVGPPSGVRFLKQTAGGL